MYENENERNEVYSKVVKAGRRAYLFDVRQTRNQDYYITITERKRLEDGESYHKQKIFLYKEDFNKFLKGLDETIDYVKTELLPDFEYDKPV